MRTHTDTHTYIFSSDHFIKTFRLEAIFPLAIPSRRNYRNVVAVDIKNFYKMNLLNIISVVKLLERFSSEYKKHFI